MTFRLADPDQAYPTPVVVDVPSAEGPAPHECRLHFRLLDQERARELALEGDEPYLQAILGGWEGIEAADGTELLYTPANVAMLALVPYFARAAITAYQRFVAGLPGKTSPTPPAAGAAAGRRKRTSKRTRRSSGSS